MENMKSCRCPHHSATAVFLVLLALTLFLGNAGIIAEHTADMIWPVFLGLIGLQKLFGSRCKCCDKSSGCCSPKSGSGSDQCCTKP